MSQYYIDMIESIDRLQTRVLVTQSVFRDTMSGMLEMRL